MVVHGFGLSLLAVNIFFLKGGLIQPPSPIRTNVNIIYTHFFPRFEPVKYGTVEYPPWAHFIGYDLITEFCFLCNISNTSNDFSESKL